MLDALITGRLYAKAKTGTTKTGGQYVTAKLLVPVAEERVFCNIITFAPSACAALLALDEGESVAVAGELHPKLYEAKDGTTKLAMDCTAHAAITTYHVQRKRKAATP